MRQANQSLSTAVNPVNIESGAPQDAVAVQQQLDQTFETIEAVADEASLPESSYAKIRKAKRMAQSWVDSVRRWWVIVEIRLADLNQPVAVVAMIRNVLIPIIYLSRAIAQARDSDQAQALRDVRSRLLKKLHAPGGIWQTLPRVLRKQLAELAQDLVDLFQRSSSSIEGRNGYLSLHHHHLRGLRLPLLTALTVVHNYVLRRPDGTTAAERFFGQKPDDLFIDLCQVMPFPARPRKRQAQPAEDILKLAS
jgi:hypothetical protein